MMKYKFVIIFLQLIKSITTVEEKSMQIKLLSAKCHSFDQSRVKISLCRVKSLSRNLSVLNIEVDLPMPVEEPIFIATDLYVKSSTRFNPTWPTIRYEFCSAMRNEGLMGKMLHYIHGFFRDSVPQLFQKCPFKAGHLDLRNITVDNSRKFPLEQMLASNTFKIQILLTQGNQDIFKLDLQFDLKSKYEWNKWQWGENVWEYNWFIRSNVSCYYLFQNSKALNSSHE